MKRTIVALIAVLALAALAAPALAAGWRTVVVSEDADASEYGSLDLNLNTSILNVRALQLVTKTTVPLKAYTARVSCKLGETNAERSIKLVLTSGTKALPVPIPGGRCTVDVWLTSFDPGRATVKLQAR